MTKAAEEKQFPNNIYKQKWSKVTGENKNKKGWHGLCKKICAMELNTDAVNNWAESE